MKELKAYLKSVEEAKKMRREERIKTELVPKIVAKLHAEGMTKENYSEAEAIRILNQCVRATLLTDTLFKYESLILDKL